jgi:hypothetical protein
MADLCLGPQGNGVTAEEEEEEEEDDDDMFFMPMPSAALKMADAKKFASLAAPLTRHDGTAALPGQPAPIFELIDGETVLGFEMHSLAALHRDPNLSSPCLKQSVVSCTSCWLWAA